jgi:hypothetical protein
MRLKHRLGTKTYNQLWKMVDELEADNARLREALNAIWTNAANVTLETWTDDVSDAVSALADIARAALARGPEGDAE